MRLRHPGSVRRGVALLEVLTALVIFFLSAVVISQMVDSASRLAVKAQRHTRAALLAETKINEVIAGIIPLSSTGPSALPEAEGWQWSLTCQPETWTATNTPSGATVNGLWLVQVAVSTSSGDVEYTLSRVIVDPRFKRPEQ